MVTLLFVLGGIFLLLAIHPFVIYPLSLALVRRLVKVPDSLQVGKYRSQQKLRFAICMCAYNEERVIRQKVVNLLALRDHEPDLEIFVYVDGATDRTAEILREYSEQIRLFVSPERHGKTHGMNLLVAQATAQIIVFTDATVLLDGEVMQKLRPYFDDSSVGCVCGHLVYTNSGESVTATSGSLYWRVEELIKKLEQDTGSVMGADGSLFAIRKALHHPPPDHLIDDMYVSFMILADGYRIVQAADAIAYEASVSDSREEFRRKARIACQAFNVHRFLWPHIRRLDPLTVYKYLSHKLVRWFTIYSLSLSLVFLLMALSLAGMPLAALLLVFSILAALAIGCLWTVKPFSQIADLLVALGGVGFGIWQSMRGKRYQTWVPAASIRKA
jgi:cellulose synthase/poly-beta-1,6-N-acetylglucosamine synthase-like glycosyltransferase